MTWTDRETAASAGLANAFPISEPELPWTRRVLAAADEWDRRHGIYRVNLLELAEKAADSGSPLQAGQHVLAAMRQGVPS